MTQICHVHKAQRTVEEVETVTIHIYQTFPDTDPAAALATHEGDASRLADALLDALPGGTVDRLLAELLERRASLLRVRFLATDGGPS